MRSRTRRLKSACLVMLVSGALPRGPPSDRRGRRGRRPCEPRPRGGPPFASTTSPAGAGWERLGADGRRPSMLVAGRRADQLLATVRRGRRTAVAGVEEVLHPLDERRRVL